MLVGSVLLVNGFFIVVVPGLANTSPTFPDAAILSGSLTGISGATYQGPDTPEKIDAKDKKQIAGILQTHQHSEIASMNHVNIQQHQQHQHSPSFPASVPVNGDMGNLRGLDPALHSLKARHTSDIWFTLYQYSSSLSFPRTIRAHRRHMSDRGGQNIKF